MKILKKLIDGLLIRAIAWTGVPIYGLGDFVEWDGSPETLDADPARRPSLRLRFAV